MCIIVYVYFVLLYFCAFVFLTLPLPPIPPSYPYPLFHISSSSSLVSYISLHSISLSLCTISSVFFHSLSVCVAFLSASVGARGDCCSNLGVLCNIRAPMCNVSCNFNCVLVRHPLELALLFLGLFYFPFEPVVQALYL